MDRSATSRGASLLALALAVSVVATPAWSQPGKSSQRVIIRSTGSHDQLRQQVQAAGGRILQDFHNVNAVSAEIPLSALPVIAANADFKMTKSTLVPQPVPRSLFGSGKGVVRLNSAGVIPVAPDTLLRDRQLMPADYSFNNGLINATVVQNSGNVGKGIIVASIDSGVANNATVVPSLEGNVIGGESFVDDPGISATSTKNGQHGTLTMSMTAAHALFLFPNTSCFAQSVKLNAPDSALDGAQFGVPGTTVIPMQGVAPGASIYAIKVSGHEALGAFEDDLIAGIDRVITLKKNFLAGKASVPVSGSGTEGDPFVYDSLNVQVANLSLGGLTLYAGHDLTSELVDQMTDVDIVVTISAANDGPSGITIGSLASSFSALSAGATATAQQDRIAIESEDPTCPLGIGALFRPALDPTMAFFSSRGPTADGRYGVDVVTSGEFNYTQGADGSVLLVDGTSFAAPTVAGAAALIRKAVPNASALEVKEAVILTANPRVLGDRSTRFDRGSGYLDTASSIKLLQRSLVVQAGVGGHLREWLLANISNDPPDGLGFFGYHPTDSVAKNIARLGLPAIDVGGNGFSAEVRPLRPFERQEFLIDIPKNAASVHIHINSVTPTLPPAQQNQFYGDDLILTVHDAKTSEADRQFNVYPVFAFIASPSDFDIDHPEPGLMRITFVGDVSNVGTAAASFNVTSTREGKPAIEKAGTINNGDQIVFPVNIPAGTATASFELTFDHDWSAYPTNDLDLVLMDPNGNLNFDGAALNGRERAVVQNPAGGTWQVMVIGFDIKGKLGADGNIIPHSKQEDKFDFKLFLQDTQ